MSEILRTKKVIMEALAARRDRDRSSGTKPTAEPAGAREKKRTKVVKRKLPQGLIDHMKARPYHIVDDMSDDQLVNCTPSVPNVKIRLTLWDEGSTKDFRQLYTEKKL